MSTRKPVVAVIDDDLDLLLGLDEMLLSLGYRTELYSSAEQFLNTVPRSQATCLVVDVNLDEITGIEMVRHLHAEGVRFPLVFMSGNVDEAVLQQAAELSPADFLQKPFSSRRLADAIKKMLGVTCGE